MDRDSVLLVGENAENMAVQVTDSLSRTSTGVVWKRTDVEGFQDVILQITKKDTLHSVQMLVGIVSRVLIKNGWAFHSGTDMKDNGTAKMVLYFCK
jgi:hypothetical protein